MVYHHAWSVRLVRAHLTGQERNAHRPEHSGATDARFGEDLGLGLRAPFRYLQFHLEGAGHTGKQKGRGR